MTTATNEVIAKPSKNAINKFKGPKFDEWLQRDKLMRL